MALNAVTPNFSRNYGSSDLRSGRDVEYDAFSRVTRMLREADREGRSPAAIQAVYKNNELWTILASDLADPGNRLPDELRAGLLSLAFFSLRHGREVMAGKQTTDSLIDVNMSIMKGLRGEAVK